MLLSIACTMCSLALTAAAGAQPEPPQSAPRGGRPSAAHDATAAVEWPNVGPDEQAALGALLHSPDWPIRAFGLLRLERYKGVGANALVLGRLKDDAWQVRCFALRQARRMSLEIDPATFADESDGRVIRAALRCGARVDAKRVNDVATSLLRTKAVDELMLGLEIAAACDIEAVRAEAAKRAERLIRNLDDAIAAVISKRLVTILGIAAQPRTALEWAAWLKAHREPLALAFPSRPTPQRTRDPVPSTVVSTLDVEAFTRLLDYLGALRGRDLDLVIVMDATASMIPMINQARAGVDSLILFLDDISRDMRLAFIAYRDHDNPPTWDGHPFTTDVNSIRDYLFKLRVTGGADYPEAVLDGINACTELKWNKQATRQIVLVGDAPPHEEDVYRVRALLESLRDSGMTMHAIHVPMEYPPRYYERLSPEQALEARQFIEKYNRDTAEMFQELAAAGGGRMTPMADSGQLVLSIMHFTIEEAWWPVFDEFYGLYVELCR